MGLPITPFIAALNSPIPHWPPAHFAKAVWVQKSLLSGSGMAEQRGHASLRFLASREPQVFDTKYDIVHSAVTLVLQTQICSNVTHALGKN